MAREQIAKCWAEYHTQQAEVNAEKERELLAKLVEREIQEFREQVQSQHAAEEQRMRFLYSGKARGVVRPSNNS